MHVISHLCVYIYGLFLFLLNGIPSCGRITIFFSLFSVKGHLRCFQFWIMMNKAMVNTHIQVFVGTHVASMGCVINTSGSASTLSFSMVVPVCVSTSLCEGVPHSHQHFATVRLKEILAILISVFVISCYGLNLHFPDH